MSKMTAAASFAGVAHFYRFFELSLDRLRSASATKGLENPIPGRGAAMAEGARAYWNVEAVNGWRLHFVATDAGLALVTWPGQSFDTVKEFANTHLPGYVLCHEPASVKGYEEAVHRYFDPGRLDVRGIRFDLRGSVFQLAVWRALMAIPYGQTRTYGEIADQIGRPSAVRAVARAVGANPVAFLVPCHRVIGKDGRLTGYRGGIALKETLLELEGAHGLRCALR